ncbi:MULTISPECIES: ABC transporter substrate-binding protein [unclassified Polaromonas]|jgi:ABC-type branched-subunit amino acid transport system substrate-binding protein|uniref:ABC transporter substrate-binding protein n=1 Tax=unclassified Polaromonas TaxID=2638319 RepID=UPI000BCEAF15|nr:MULTISPECIES: ABC transporter substrate-binding protein [unclassified Polaromonas]OYY39754.1 MAG: ABC transporter permease [Polaromonas sp. 35-63-35]OYZ22499.1 MAG: ABC transporter permease [Polaromonas sp. 16-63-31]OYZ81285.1 MAG: ABC transporter permease [Polaromonas sp. 24-63-21]OZA52494.1 MAG: ABC transporter permease [Polaromonas sp. 17-63-33]OZA88646.1 MAG: ABC transporter permease [Polaromonas sp. 39-63-25]
MLISRRKLSLTAGAAMLAGFNIARAQSDSKIILGQSAAFTGPAAQLGIQFYQGAKVYFDQVNAQGGVGKRQIEIRNLDDGYEPDRCAENTRKLIADDVFALFGYIGTPTSLAALPLATKDKVPFIAPFTGAMGLREPFNKYAFHVRASYNDETGLIVKQLTSLGLKKIAVFYQNDAYGKAGLDGVTLALNGLGLKTVAQATVERNSVDVAKAVQTLVAAAPDAVVQISAYKSCAAFIRAARKAGYGGTFYNVSFVGTQALADELGKDGAGVVVSQVMPSPYNAARPIAREFADAVKAAGKDAQANFSSMEGYVAAKLFVEGLKRASGKLSRESLIAGLESLGSQSLGGFSVSFSPTDHVASAFVELSMLTGDGRVRT